MPTSNVGVQKPAVVVSATTTAASLIAADPGRQSLTIRADSANTQSCYYGPATVTSATGMEIRPGEIHGFGPGEAPVNALQIISASGTQNIRVQDVGT